MVAEESRSELAPFRIFDYRGDRFGNAFAISACLALKTAVGTAYTQLLWHRLSSRYTRIRTINNGFDALNNSWSLASLGVAWKMHLSVIVAFVLWCLPISTLLAPATFSVRQNVEVATHNRTALVPDINKPNLVPAFITRSNGGSQFERSSMRMKRIAGAVVYTGSCHANETTKHDILELVNNELPSRNRTGDSLKWYNHPFRNREMGENGYVGALRDDLYQQLTMDTTNYRFSNEITNSIKRNRTDDYYQSETDFLECQLWNASVNYNNISVINGVRNIALDSSRMLNKVDIAGTFITELGHLASYSGYLSSLADYLIGNVWCKQFHNMMMEMGNFTDLQEYFDEVGEIRDTSFAQDVEEYALNVSLSLMSAPSMCKYVPVEVTFNTTHTVYAYNPRNLLLSYGIAILLSTISAILGLLSIFRSASCHIMKFSSIAVAMQNDQVHQALLENRISITQLLNRDAANVKLRFQPRRGFVLAAGDSEPLMKKP